MFFPVIMLTKYVQNVQIEGEKNFLTIIGSVVYILFSSCQQAFSRYPD